MLETFVFLEIPMPKSGADSGGGGGVKSWFFTRNTPKIFAPPSAIGYNMIFWHKIVIFHTKYPQQFSCLPPLGAIFLSAPPLTWNPGSAPASCYTKAFIISFMAHECIVTNEQKNILEISHLLLLISTLFIVIIGIL